MCVTKCVILSPRFFSFPAYPIATYTVPEIHGCSVDQPRNLAKSVTVE